MKNILILTILSIFLLFSCEAVDNKNTNNKSDNNPVAPIVFPGDDEDDPVDEDEVECESDNEEVEEFIAFIDEYLGENANDIILDSFGNNLRCAIIGCYEENFKNHGKFVSCISHLTNRLKKEKIITGRQKGVIVSAAARTDIGKKK